MGAERAEALEVLRVLWRGQAQGVDGLDDSGESHCKKMTDAGVGFEDYAAGNETDRIAGRGGPGLSARASSARPAASPTSSCGRPRRPPTISADHG